MSEELKPCPGCGEKGLLEIFGYSSASSFAICCGDCGMRSPTTGRTKSEAITIWNALPRRLRWTKEKPTKQGWYWCRHEDGGIHIGCFMAARDYPGYGEGVIEWAGPIPEPEPEEVR